MRKFYNFLMFVAIIATTLFASCSKDIDAPITNEPVERIITIVADNNLSVDSRTVIDATNPDNYKVKWSENGEKLCVYESIDNDATSNANINSSEGVVASEKATFAVGFNAHTGGT